MRGGKGDLLKIGFLGRLLGIWLLGQGGLLLWGVEGSRRDGGWLCYIFLEDGDGNGNGDGDEGKFVKVLVAFLVMEIWGE